MLLEREDISDLPMQDNFKKTLDDEIDLNEFFNVIWRSKFFIVIACAIGLFLGGYHASTTNKEFTASASFKLSKPEKSGLSDQLSIIKSITGVGNLSGSSLPINEIMGREFIVLLDGLIDLRGDTFFFDDKPTYKDPAWKSIIKNMVGFQSVVADPNEVMWQNIIRVYRSNIDISSSTEEDAIVVSVTHESAIRSAEIANTIMKTIIQNQRNRSSKDQIKQLNYLSETIADALFDTEVASSKLKKFLLENNSKPLENFTQKTLRLDSLRQQFTKTTEILNALAKLSLLLDAGLITQSDYELMRNKFPIVDQVEFRRLLGQNEVVNSWVWPDKSLIDKVFDTLSERQNRLDASIITAQTDATKAGQAKEEYTKLMREVKNAEATYKVYIEQIKAHTMVAGYLPEISFIYEYAAPPISPSSPNLKNILYIGIISGFLFGCILAVLFKLYRGTYYSYKSLLNQTQARINIKAHHLRNLRQVHLSEINTLLSRKSKQILRSLAIEIHGNGNNQVLFTSLNSKLKSNDVARALASYLHSGDLKIALINFNVESQQPSSHDEVASFGSFNLIEKVEKISILQPDNKLEDTEFIARSDFQSQLRLLHSNFDLIFLSADNDDAMSLASALNRQHTYHISLARIKKTNSKSLINLQTLLPIQGLLYE
jgi:uncharacterized protein involved in exopolysaccharide biosynthesis